MNQKEEIIKEILEFWDDKWEGFKILTNKQTIEIKISTEELCCENWGHISCDENFNQYIGSFINDIVLVDDKLNLKPAMKKFVGEWVSNDSLEDDCGTRYIFVNVITNSGTMQLALYNDHNGFYGHDVTISSTQLNKKDGI